MTVKFDPILGALREQDSIGGLGFTPSKVFNVTDYGATADGTADDTSAINSTISAASSAGGGVVYLPKGTYKISAAGGITPSSKVSIIGEGIDNTIILPYGTISAIKLLASSSSPLKDCCFADFTIDGANQSGTYNTGIKGIFVQYLERCTFRRLTIKNTGATGLGIDYLRDCIASEIIAENCGRLGPGAGSAGIGIGTSSSFCYNNTFINCTTRNNSRCGIFFESQDHSYAEGYRVINHFSEDNGDHGIADAGCYGLQVIGGVSRNNGQAGFAVYGGTIDNSYPGTNGLVANLETYGNLYGVLYQNGAGSYYATGNYTFRNLKVYQNTYGINVRPSDTVGHDMENTVIDGCDIYENNQQGIRFGIYTTATSGLKRLVIRNNRIFNNGLSTNPHGIDFYCPITGGEIAFNSCFDSQATQTQTYGFVKNGTTNIWSGNLAIHDNDLRGNKTGGLIATLSSLTPTVVIKNNLGYNPVGISSITVGSSPFTYTAGNSPEQIFLYGGTVSSISKKSTTVCSGTPATVRLEPSESITVTYSSAPTIVKDIL